MRVTRRQSSPFGRLSSGAAATTPTWPLPFQARGIRIAADSDMDVVDLYPNSRVEPDNRIRVSVGRPWMGDLPAGTNEFLAVPVRATETLAGFIEDVPDETAIGTMPRLVVDFIEDGDIHHGECRAPLRLSFARTGTAHTGNRRYIRFPVMGRTRISVAIHTSGDSSYAIYGIDTVGPGQEAGQDVAVASGSIVSATTEFVQWVYEGPPYDYIDIELTSLGASADVNVSVDALDGEL